MKNCTCLFFLCSILFFQHSYSQNSSNGENKIDSLLGLLKTDKEDTGKVIHQYKLCDEYRKIGEFELGLKYGKLSLELSQSLTPLNNGIKRNMAGAHHAIGNIYFSQGNYSKALKSYFAALKIQEELVEKKGIAKSYTNIGNVYTNMGNYPDALRNFFTSLKIAEELGDKHGVADTYNNIGVVYDYQENYKEALINYFASLKIRG